MKKLAVLAKQHRQMLHLTQIEYAKRMGFRSATACSLWEDGKRKVPTTVIEAILLNPLPRYNVCKHCDGRGLIEITSHKETN